MKAWRGVEIELHQFLSSAVEVIVTSRPLYPM